MAVDTKEKRFSMCNFGWSYDVLLPDPDGSLSALNRQHLLNCYSGVTFQGPPELKGIREWHRLYRRIPRF